MEADIVQLISNLGFPIACTVALFAMLNKERSDHKDEVKAMTEAVNNNTSVLKQILVKLGVGENG